MATHFAFTVLNSYSQIDCSHLNTTGLVFGPEIVLQ